jgi:nicotinate-nucleotide--dimethylbenzimidazole phosphoribosyltransferase
MTMSTDTPPLIAPTARASLEQALRLKLARRNEVAGSLGELEPLAIRLGLIQNALRPRLRQPQLLVFAGDHGLAVEVTSPQARSTGQTVEDLLAGRLPLPVLAHRQGLTVHLVDSGLANPLVPRTGVLARKIAHGTRNCRVTQAMSIEQVHAAIRAGMEITDALPGNALGCAGVGVGAPHAAALVISKLTGIALRELVFSGATMDITTLEQQMMVLQSAQTRHMHLDDPVEVLAAFGGFETAMMVGAMLVAASKRHLILVDGLSACAALIVAARIGGPVTDYCVFCRSTGHHGLDATLRGFQTTALLELGLESIDGTGIALSWPLVQAAASLLTEVHDAVDNTAPTADDGYPSTLSMTQPLRPESMAGEPGKDQQVTLPMPVGGLLR